MSNKRKQDLSSEQIKSKIRRLESQLQQKTKQRSRCIIYSESEDESDSNIEGICIVPNDNGLTNNSSPAIQEQLGLAEPAFMGLPSTSQTAEIHDSVEIHDSAEAELDSEILALLGDAPKADIKFGKPTHKELASRWQEILEKGLPKESKDKLMTEYLIPENCYLLVAPSLNPEVKVALADNMIKRDMSLLTKQKQLSVAVAAINQAIELIIFKESHTKILKPISDACRLLCDSHCTDSRTRRGFIISSINSEMKETLAETKRDNLLFGENISEKLKSAKAIKRSAADLKQTGSDKSQAFNKNNFIKHNKGPNNRLNWKTMPRKITPKIDQSKTRQNLQPSTHKGSQQRGPRETERTTGSANSRRR